MTGKILTEPANMNQLLFGHGIVPNVGISSGIEGFICFSLLTLFSHKESILKEDIKPFIKGDSVVVGRYNVL